MNAHVADCDSPVPSLAPDWDAIEIDVLCSQCGYNLRTLQQPRCPECGRAFDWQSELEHARRQYVALFEVTWRTRPVRAWLFSLLAPLRPWRLFQRMREAGPPRTGPLIVLLLLSPVTYFALLHVVNWTFHMLELTVSRPYSRFEWFVVEFRYAAPDVLCDGATYLLTPLSMALFQLGLIGALSLFHDTRRRLDLRTRDMLRLVAYAAGGAQFLWCASLCSALYMSRTYVQIGSFAALLYCRLWELVLICLPPILLWLYVWLALRNYCKAPHAAAWSALSAVVAVLFTFAVLSVFRFPF